MDSINYILYYSGIALWIAIIMWLILRLIFGKNWLLKVGGRFFLGPGLMQSAKKLKNEIKERDIRDDTLTEVAVRIFWRLTRLGVIGLLIAGLPVWLLFNQNQLINKQNELFEYQNIRIDEQTELIKAQTGLLSSQDEKLATQNRLFSSQNDLFTDQNQKIDLQSDLLQDQNYFISLQKVQIDSQISLLAGQNKRIDTQNDRINIQNNLLEADRRSSLVFLMSNILDKVDEEIKGQKNEFESQNLLFHDSTKYSLSKPLIRRIVALSRAFRPYRMMKYNELSKQLQSPERGQLFISLMENSLDSLTQNTIAKDGYFSYAIVESIDLSNANLVNVNFKGADLNHADLRKANLYDAYLPFANFYFANLSEANLEKADFSNANLKLANLDRANLREVKFVEADLYKAELRGADLREAKFLDANLKEARLRISDLDEAYIVGADLRDVDLYYCSLVGSNLKYSDLENADLEGADLERANLEGVNLKGVDLSEANLTGARGLNLQQLIKARTLYQCYGLDSTLYKQLKMMKPCLFESWTSGKDCD